MKKMLLVMVLLALLVTGIRLAGNLAAGFGNSGNGGEVSAPEKLEDSEVRQRLQQLSEQYEDYREIYEHMDEYPIKLLAALGAWLGMELVIYTMILASVLFVLYALARRMRVGAFGPAITIAAIMIAFYFF